MTFKRLSSPKRFHELELWLGLWLGLSLGLIMARTMARTGDIANVRTSPGIVNPDFILRESMFITCNTIIADVRTSPGIINLILRESMFITCDTIGGRAKVVLLTPQRQ